MKAYLLYEAGGPEKLVLGEAATPALKSGEVLIRVRAIGINPADTIYRSSPAFIQHLFGQERPVIMGWDVAGTVVATAGNTHGLQAGDDVLALLQHAGGYAEFVAADAGLLARKPAHSSFEQAAAAPMAGLTAWQPLVHGMHIVPGSSILIHGAAGGVGHYAVQIARHLGARVIATSSARNRDFVLGLGAHEHIDYQAVDFRECVQDVDFVLDTVGGETLERSIDVTRPGGTIISIVALSDEGLMVRAREKKVNLSLRALQFSGDDLRAFAGLMDRGILKPHIAATYPFAAMAEAHARVETRRTAGKIVVTV